MIDDLKCALRMCSIEKQNVPFQLVSQRAEYLIKVGIFVAQRFAAGHIRINEGAFSIVVARIATAQPIVNTLISLPSVFICKSRPRVPCWKLGIIISRQFLEFFYIFVIPRTRSRGIQIDEWREIKQKESMLFSLFPAIFDNS